MVLAFPDLADINGPAAGKRIGERCDGW